MTIAEEKQAQRAAGRAARKALDAPQRAALTAALCRRGLRCPTFSPLFFSVCKTRT